MESFNEHLINLLASCRDNAIEELRSNQRYCELKKEHSDLRTNLESQISPESKTILDEFLYIAVRIQVMEFNKVLLCGLTTSTELQKCFDASTPEHKIFADEYLQI